MTKRKALKVIALITAILLLAVLFGYLASMLIKVAMVNFFCGDDIDLAKKQIDGYFDTIFENLENDGLISDRTKIKNKRALSHVDKKTSFSIENIKIEIVFVYYAFTGDTVVTVSISETEESINNIDSFENEKVNSVLSILDKCFDTGSFNKLNKLCDESFLLENYSSNKNDSGIVKYELGTHRSVYKTNCLYEPDTVYSYCVSKVKSGYEYKANIKYNI